MNHVTRPALRLIRGDCIEEMQSLDSESVHAVVTDPPYGIRFMGKAWDGTDIERRAAARRMCPSKHERSGDNGAHRSIAAEAGKYDRAPGAMLAFQEFSEAWAREALRVLKPGGYLLSFASPRTYHRMAAGIEDAGFEIRDQIMWVFGSGFPKSHNGDWGGTALKPAHEPIVVARKPLVGTVAQNVLKHGTGALNIDGCRVGMSDGDAAYIAERISGFNATRSIGGNGAYSGGETMDRAEAYDASKGRWPANLIHDGSDEVLTTFPDSRSAGNYPSESESRNGVTSFKGKQGPLYADNGSAARFFYCAKASRADRNDGVGGGAEPAVTTDATPRDCETADWQARNGNHHPTVKPTELMRYLVRLVTPAGGVVLDPFMGSGSTGRGAVLEGFGFIGIEKDQDEDGKPLGYFPIAEARIAAAQRQREIDTAQPNLFTEDATC